MVIAAFGDGEEIDDSCANGEKAFGVFRKAFAGFAEDAILKSGVVNVDGAAVSAEVDEGLCEGAGGIVAREVEEIVMHQVAVGSEDVEAELERDLRVGSGAGPDRDSELDGLEIEEVSGESVRREVCGGSVGVEEDGVCLRVGFDSALEFGEIVIGNVAQVVDADRFQHFDFGSPDVR